MVPSQKRPSSPGPRRGFRTADTSLSVVDAFVTASMMRNVLIQLGRASGAMTLRCSNWIYPLGGDPVADALGVHGQAEGLPTKS